MPPLHLQGGINFSTWPDLKWSRANAHYATLQSRFAEWEASAPSSVEGILRDDRKAIDLFVRTKRGVPTHEWALTIGDALHNLRSALDAVAWGMAHYNEATPKRPRSITFPICTEESKWRDALKAWISDIEPEFQERLLAVQPFSFAPGAAVTPIQVLHELDVQDKHRDFVTVKSDVNQVRFDIHYEYEEHVDEDPRVELRDAASFADGDQLGTIHTGAPIKPFMKLEIRPTSKVLIHHNGVQHEMTTLLPLLFGETRRCLDVLMYGLASTDSSDDPGSDAPDAPDEPSVADPI